MEKYLQKALQYQFVRKIQNNMLTWILLLAAALRFTGLTKRDFWYDEAFTGVAIKERFSDMVIMIINDVHPPLYYIALKGFAIPFHYSVFGIRLFSAVFGVLAVWATYLFAKELCNRRVGLWAAFLATISPFAIQYSQEARMYSMLVTLILFAAFFFIKALHRRQVKYYVLWGLFTGLSMLVHYMGIIFAATYAIAYLLWLLFTKEKISKHTISIEFLSRIFNKNIFIGYSVAFLVFLPWLTNFIHHFLMKGNNLSWVKPASFGDIIVMAQMALFGTPLGEMSSGMPQPNELYGISHISIRMILAVLLGASLIFLNKRVAKEKLVLLFVFSFGFMTIIYGLSLFTKEQQYFVARYLLPGAYFLFVYIAVVLSEVSYRWIGILLATYIALLTMVVPLANSTGYNLFSQQLGKYKNNNFYILNSFDYVITKYYLGANRLTLYNYDWPQYNPAYWAAIGPTLKRTENFDDLRNDPNALIISNKQLNRDNQYFKTSGLTLVDQYNNILIYKFDQTQK